MVDRVLQGVRRWARHHPDDLAAMGLFVVARAVVIGVLGVRMDLRFLTFAPHLPDIGLLQDRLLETVAYQHTQPPLYAAAVGLLLKLSPFPDGITFQVVHLLLGLGLAVALRRVFSLLGLRRASVFVALALVVTNPALIAIEFVASYDQPTILLLALLVLKTGRYLGAGRGRDLAWVAGLAAAIVLTRTVFHPIWFALVVAGAIAMRRPTVDRRRLAAIVALPALAIAAPMAKNLVLYGEPTLTTFTGPSLSKIAGSAARPEERARLQADGTVSALFGLPVFWGWETYEGAMPPCTVERADVPVLAEEVRPNGGYPNMNYECMLDVYRQQGDDASAYIRAEPARFLAAQLGGTQMFFEPSLPIIFTTNDSKLEGLDDAYAWTLFHRVELQPVTYTEFGQLRVLNAGGLVLVPILVLLDAAAIAIGGRRFVQLVRRRTRTGTSDRRASYGTWAAVGLACAWVTVIGSLFEVNENARYRQLVEPYLVAVLVLAGERAVAWIGAERAARSGAAHVDVEADVEHR